MSSDAKAITGIFFASLVPALCAFIAASIQPAWLSALIFGCSFFVVGTIGWLVVVFSRTGKREESDV